MFAATVMMLATAIAIGVAKKLNLGSIVALRSALPQTEGNESSTKR
jgi:hypothetical protein